MLKASQDSHNIFTKRRRNSKQICFFIFSTFLDTVLGYILILFFSENGKEKKKGINERNKRIKIKWLQYSELIVILFSFIPDRIIWKRWKGPQKEKEKRTRKKKRIFISYVCMNLMYFYINRASCTYNNLLTISILLAGFIGWTVFSEQAFLKVFLSMSITLFIYLFIYLGILSFFH